MTAKAALLLLLALYAGGALASQEAVRGWTTSVQLGANATSGNTVGASVTGELDAAQELDNWSNRYVVSAFLKDDQIPDEQGEPVHVRSAQRYAVSAKAALKLKDPREKLFVLASYVDDRFGAFVKYATLAAGRTSRVCQAAGRTLDIDVGPGYFTGTRADGEAQAGLIARGAAALKWKIGDSAVFANTLSVERSAVNFRTVTEASLSTKITDAVQMKAAFTARNDSEVPAERKRTDTQTSLSLVYSF
jgi:putative salt-induced outer membrane protein